MRRRTVLLAGAASAMLAGVPLGAQDSVRKYRLGVVLPMAGLAAKPYLEALREQLATHGFVEGSNLVIEPGYPFDFTFKSGLETAHKLAGSNVDALFICTTILTLAGQRAAPSMPIVFAWVSDPDRSGIVKSLSRPGSNANGVTNRFVDLAAKRVELVHELAPAAKRVAVVAGRFDASLVDAMKVADRTAGHFGMTLHRIEAGYDWKGAVWRAVAEGAEAMLVTTPFALFGLRDAAETVVKQSIENRLMTVFSDIESVELGGLVAYAPNLASDVRRGADVLARVLRGEKPADIAVDQAARFELAINLRTARAIGASIPQALLVRADRVIE